MNAFAQGSPEPDRMDDPAHHVVQITHTPWTAQDKPFVARLRAGDADEVLGRVLLEHLRGDDPAEMRKPDTIPPSRMFHALSWIVQQGYALQERERVEQTEAQRRTGHSTLRRQWRLDPSGQGPPTVQTALF